MAHGNTCVFDWNGVVNQMDIIFSSFSLKYILKMI